MPDFVHRFLVSDAFPPPSGHVFMKAWLDPPAPGGFNVSTGKVETFYINDEPPFINGEYPEISNPDPPPNIIPNPNFVGPNPAFIGLNPHYWGRGKGRPSRLNPVRPQGPNGESEHGFKYFVTVVGVEVEVRCRPRDADGALLPEGVLDSELPLDGPGGLEPRLFDSEMLEYPSVTAPVFSSPVGQTSIQRFTPTAPGHYTWKIRRPQGGAIILHVDAEEAP